MKLMNNAADVGKNEGLTIVNLRFSTVRLGRFPAFLFCFFLTC